jgi:hypothetical protein
MQLWNTKVVSGKLTAANAGHPKIILHGLAACQDKLKDELARREHIQGQQHEVCWTVNRAPSTVPTAALDEAQQPSTIHC